jgi:hypothetical protein
MPLDLQYTINYMDKDIQCRLKEEAHTDRDDRIEASWMFPFAWTKVIT